MGPNSVQTPGLTRGVHYRIQVLDRAFAILDLLAEARAPLTLTEISRHLQVHKTTVLRLLVVLQAHGYVRRDEHGAYQLGSRLIELGAKALDRIDLIRAVRPFLRRLVEQTGETAHMAVLREGQVLSLANVESPRTLRTPSTVGRRSPAHCTAVGKAILAYLPEAQVMQILRSRGLTAFTANTITAPDSLLRELELVRRRGYAVDNEEFEEGVRCIGAPIFDHTGKVIAALSITGPATRISLDRVPALAPYVMKAAADLSEQLGYARPASNE